MYTYNSVKTLWILDWQGCTTYHLLIFIEIFNNLTEGCIYKCECVMQLITCAGFCIYINNFGPNNAGLILTMAHFLYILYNILWRHYHSTILWPRNATLLKIKLSTFLNVLFKDDNLTKSLLSVLGPFLRVLLRPFFSWLIITIST